MVPYRTDCVWISTNKREDNIIPYSFTVDVTKEDIKEGMKGNPYYCPIALACKRQGLISPRVSMFLDFFSPGDNKGTKLIRLTLPRELIDFTYEFDHERTVEPISFSFAAHVLVEGENE